MWQKRVGMVVAGFASLVSSWAMADSLNLNLNEDTMRLSYEAEMQGGMKGLMFDAGYFYNDTRHVNRSDADMVHAGLHVRGNNWSQAGVFDIKVGGRMIYTSLASNVDVMALGLGGEFRFSPVHRLGIGASGYYAPRIATFLDGKHYRELGATIDYQLLEQAYIYVGYRHLKVELELASQSVVLDDSGHVGLKLTF